MTDSTKSSFSSRDGSLAEQNSWPVRYPLPYDTTGYSRNYPEYFDMARFSILLFSWAALFVLSLSDVRNTSAET